MLPTLPMRTSRTSHEPDAARRIAGRKVEARGIDGRGTTGRGTPPSFPHHALGPFRSTPLMGVALVLASLGLGCGSLTDLGGKPSLPSGVQDPATFRTPAGALAMYRATVADFQHTLAGYVAGAGLLTDELQDNHIGESPLTGSGGFGYNLDVRVLPGGDDRISQVVYHNLHSVRRDAVQAIGALRQYDSAAHPALMGEAYALEGYAEVLLADLYCSGIPLSTIAFEGDYVFRPGSSTQEVYRHAVTLFDSALALSGDSARVLNLARVGKGRALVDLGDFAGAAAAVAAVPDTFRYQFPVLWTVRDNGSNIGLVLAAYTTVSDREGLNGLPYISSGDPRTQVVETGTNDNGVPVYFPAKYGAPGSTTPLTTASGVEARLIEAEAALHGVSVAGGTAVTILNQLRQAYDPSLSPPLNAGLSGPALVDTLFAERAAWLFVTGTRQGDLRRLIRLYGRNQAQVYPSGFYPGRGGWYGTDVNVPIPSTEQYNPLFTGCFNRGA